jgi:PhnB protein
MSVRPIPAGYNTLTPGCALRGAAKAIELYQKVFGAEQRIRFDAPDGSVAHAELKFGDSLLMLGEASDQSPAHATHLMMYVADCDSVFKRAVEAGFKVKEPIKVQFWGDRTGRVTDPFGNEWFIATHVEDVSEAEMKKRMAKLMGG